MKVSITREYAWEMGHSLMHHKGKCYNVHGHNYKLELEVSGEVDSVDGMVWDFGLLDKTVKPLIEEQLDHKFLYNKEDTRFHSSQIDGTTAFDKEPTAENLALWIWEILIGYFQIITRSLQVESVTIYETDKSWATVRGS
ncbi:6-carboxytetrahydropterin synthase QueD [bacterium]|nr:6-carboxytetrahydropterin synthase QueD [bacterium]